MHMFSAHSCKYQGRCVSCAQVAVLGHPWACLSICVRTWEVDTQALVGSRFMGSPVVSRGGEQFAQPQR